MSDIAAEILADISEALRATTAFAGVTLGPDEDAARWPRAEVLFSALEEMRPDDALGSRWLLLKAKVCIHLRGGQPARALERALELAGLAQEALLADRFRGQRCRDLPTGRATELGPTRPEPAVKPPYLAVTFDVHCRFESEDGE